MQMCIRSQTRDRTRGRQKTRRSVRVFELAAHSRQKTPLIVGTSTTVVIEYAMRFNVVDASGTDANISAEAKQNTDSTAESYRRHVRRDVQRQRPHNDGTTER